MCGIAGFNGDFDPRLLDRMSAAIIHRGPDGDGVFYDEAQKIGLAHRRLAIIDLSATGHQPMADDHQRAIITFNGEIYNYRTLRKDLVAKGYVFKGDSDTEVLLNLYLHHGSDMLNKLNGIFAFAIWDIRKRQLFVARDGLGVKPLYYTHTPNGFIFASEIKAILQEPTVSRELNPAAVARHLTLLWSPAPDTILKHVKKLDPGMAMTVECGEITKHWRYYELPFGVSKSTDTVADNCRHLRHSLDKAVERQMVADVPVGAFLSGGLDSSAIVASARHYSNQRLQCFTIAFNDKNALATEGMGEDLPYAQRVARHLDVDLHTITVGSDMIDSLKEMIYFLDEPQADPAPLNALFISKLARENGIKVLLSGAGGDDVLTGYRRHHALSLERYWAWLPKSVRSGIGYISHQLPVHNVFARRLRKAFEYSGYDQNERLSRYFCWLNPAEAYGLLSPDFRSGMEQKQILRPLLCAIDRLPESATRLDQMLHLESKFFLADHNLNYTDRMSMAHGVEVRVPLLDPEFVAFAARLPDDQKQHGSTGKWIFKKAMEGILPNDVIYRPKTGFGAPLRRWLRVELRPMVEELLSKKAIEQRGLFDYKAVAGLVEADRQGRIDAAYTIFALMCIELWCQIFIDQCPTYERI